MDFLKNKLLLYILAAILAVLLVVWVFWPTPSISKEKLTNWISSGYARQFCKVIHPRIAKCVTLSSSECNKFATEQIDACIAMDADQLPDTVDHTKAKEIYHDYAKCFESKVHAQLLENYLVLSQECYDRMQ